MNTFANKIDNQAQNDGDQAEPVYELRVYHAHEGKLTALMARFRDHTRRLFKKHGIKDVAYWTPTDEPLKGKTLIYLLEHKSRLAANESWHNFISDPEWIEVAAASEANGKLVDRIDSTFMSETDLSSPLT